MSDFVDFYNSTGISGLEWRSGIMLVIGLGFMFLAITKGREPYVLLPIGIGIIIANLPFTGLTDFAASADGHQKSGIFGIVLYYGLTFWDILPPIIFLGLGAMTDFSPVIANPKTLLLGAASQIGIFVAFWGALVSGSFLNIQFTVEEAAVIGIIGGADGPTTIFLSGVLAPQILGVTAVVAYTYMASVVFIQPPLMKILTTKREREITMSAPRDVSRIEKLIFPSVALIVIILVVPGSAPLISMFMMGNLFRESGVVPRLADAASNELLNITTIFLMVTVGTQLSAETMFKIDTLVIFALGMVAFGCGTMGGLLFAKFMNLILKEKINPLIGSAGVSAVPMAARISHKIGQEADPNVFLLAHAMGPNVAGVIGSAVVAGVFISLI